MFQGEPELLFFPFPAHPETLRNEQVHLFVLLMAVLSWYKEILSTCIRPLSHTDVEQFPFAALGWEGHRERNLREVGERKRESEVP